ncbi:sugar phosphate isomerase/epimerase family protein [Pedobacter nyackensis]|uniref:Sugar phosphate isomerase/epimerase n=1 Tax=Pedobacter nyackensis TaxID=475255 RepID=A0A1W2EUC4_9SPHI|nr:TIM barrel protein [Pedobacter nyackensis]SMD12816.1 Sugar phosphate isomerase/epimerase [Pedobacter nyackensis]
MKENISRKDFMKYAVVTAAGLPLTLSGLSAFGLPQKKQDSSVHTDKVSISIFSKNLQWLNFRDMAKLTAKMGFDGIDLTVRAKGHVSPENVIKDLPLAVETIRKEGLDVYTITTDIKDANEKHTVDVLKTASQLGIKNYRMGWYPYHNEADPITTINGFKKRLTDLAALNERYNIHGDYQNHTGLFGGSLWDLWMAIKDLDPRWIGCQFDVRHATVDGAKAWPTSFKLIRNHIGSLPVKDFYWAKENEKWLTKNTALGQGMVDFKQYFQLLKKYNIIKPISLHYEYPLGGAESGATTLTIPQDDVINQMQGDLQKLKSWLKEYEIPQM